MSKRKKDRQHPPKTSPKQTSNKRKTRLWQAIFAFIIIGGLVLVRVGLYPRASDKTGERRQSSSDNRLNGRRTLPATPRNPRPATLDPAQFTDPDVMNAYYVARDMPEVLEQLPCYCGCYESVRHRNNLDCFADTHGVN